MHKEGFINILGPVPNPLGPGLFKLVSLLVKCKKTLKSYHNWFPRPPLFLLHRYGGIASAELCQGPLGLVLVLQAPYKHQQSRRARPIIPFNLGPLGPEPDPVDNSVEVCPPCRSLSKFFCLNLSCLIRLQMKLWIQVGILYI